MKVQDKMCESLEKLNINYLEIDASCSIEEIHKSIIEYLEL